MAHYEKADHEVLATPQAIKESLFAEKSHVHALICDENGQAIGSAKYFFNYSTWLGGVTILIVFAAVCSSFIQSKAFNSNKTQT